MNPTHFTEANTRFHAPPDLTEQQVETISAWQSPVTGGSCDGARQIIVAWKPTADELAALNAGALKSAREIIEKRYNELERK